MLLDNFMVSFLLQLNNGIYIKPFNGKQDRQLEELYPFLIELSEAKDVRVGLKRIYHYEEMLWSNLNAGK